MNISAATSRARGVTMRCSTHQRAKASASSYSEAESGSPKPTRRCSISLEIVAAKPNSVTLLRGTFIGAWPGNLGTPFSGSNSTNSSSSSPRFARR